MWALWKGRFPASWIGCPSGSSTFSSTATEAWRSPLKRPQQIPILLHLPAQHAEPRIQRGLLIEILGQRPRLLELLDGGGQRAHAGVILAHIHALRHIVLQRGMAFG